MDAQDDVKGMLAAVKEDPQASEEEVIVLSSQQPPAGSLKSGPHVEPKVEPKVELVSASVTSDSQRVRQGQTGSDRVRQSDI
jgi:hypothetical protein